MRQDARPGAYIVNASANVRSLNRMMNWSLPTDGPKTLNGLITEYMEMIPETGTSLLLDNHPIDIVQIKDNMIKTVRIHKGLEKKQSQDNEESAE